ncbi:MAG TPA: ferritin-like domain-containing protein [Thermoanaerobaculia bacterium]|nr:ferritin-like domain-containing protein [Thermoanaerobaculia bacterium]
MSVEWNQALLQKHLQAAVDLELWTIPFYMSAMYSLKDPSGMPYRLIQSVVYQEMLHVQLAANIANAFGLAPKINEPVYRGTSIPHLNFDLDTPNPTTFFSPYSAEIGPLDLERLNAFCLIEYPEWDTGGEPSPKANIEEYGSIGEFYTALAIGANAVVARDPDSLKGDVHQVNVFERFYSGFSEASSPIPGQPTTQAMCITEGGFAGLAQAMGLLAVITDQGEGQVQGEQAIPTVFQNTADDPQPDDSHYTKFKLLRNARPARDDAPRDHPWETYPLIHYPPDDPRAVEQREAQERLRHNFRKFRQALEQLFASGELPQSFGAEMATLGGNIRRCWQLGAVPTF